MNFIGLSPFKKHLIVPEKQSIIDIERAYHIDLSWWIFLVAGLAAFAIALLTVSYQAIKAALANPVESLRYE